MLQKYRALSDDRKILDSVDELGDEIANVSQDYQELKDKITKYERYRSLIGQTRENLKELSELSGTLDLVQDTMEINHEIVDYLNILEEAIIPDAIDELNEITKLVQVRFNYYYKLSKAIQDRIQINYSPTTTPTISFSDLTSNKYSF